MMKVAVAFVWVSPLVWWLNLTAFRKVLLGL
jgi:hypothetical protein